MSDMIHCPLLHKPIEQGLCMDINLESENIMKEDSLKLVKKIINMENAEIRLICRECINYPLDR